MCRIISLVCIFFHFAACHSESLVDIDNIDSVGLHENSCDIIVFSYNRAMQLFAFLESLEKYVDGVSNVFVLYRASNDEHMRAYEFVKERFCNYHYIMRPSDDKTDRIQFKNYTMNCFVNSGSEYIMFGVDDIVIKDHFDVREGMKYLESTGAYGFFYRLGECLDFCYMINRYQGVPTLSHVGPDVCMWTFRGGRGDWNYPNNIDMTMYRKNDVKSALDKPHFTYPTELEGVWSVKADHQLSGLCYKTPRLVNIPVNVVNDEDTNRHMNSYSLDYLLQLFLKGKKIDISGLHSLQSRSCHIDYNVEFIDR